MFCPKISSKKKRNWEGGRKNKADVIYMAKDGLCGFHSIALEQVRTASPKLADTNFKFLHN